MITIPEMEHLPENCHKCPFHFWDDEFDEIWCSYHVCIVEPYDGDKKRMDICPLVETEVIG